MANLHKIIQTCSNEKFLEIYVCEEKGRGIKAKKCFAKGEFVVEYKGFF